MPPSYGPGQGGNAGTLPTCMTPPIHEAVSRGQLLARELVLPVTPPSRRLWLFWLFGPLFLCLGISLVVRAFDLDLRSQTWIFQQGDQSWALGDQPVWKAIYRFGVFPAALLVLVALLVHGVSQVRRGLRPWRLLCMFWILSTALGPGVLTNGLLKEYWGRPRPRELVEFGGHRRFEPVLTYDASSAGKSFPSGHATMGFVLMGGYFLFYRQHRRLAWTFLAVGGVGGALLGFARMAQGGHFLSDVLWAAAICWWSSLAVFYGLGLSRKALLTTVGQEENSRSWARRLGLGAATLALVAAILLGTPYREKRDYFLTQAGSDDRPIVLKLLFVTGDIHLVQAQELRIVGEAYGHGVPTSGIKASFVERVEDGQLLVSYRERHSGWLAEAKQQLRVEIPWERVTRIELETGEADLWISLPDEAQGPMIELRSGSGSVDVSGGGVAPTVTPGGDFRGTLSWK
jgi:lipid A 4'-phosphatase